MTVTEGVRELPARRKAAILCVALGAEHTARVIKLLPESRAGDLAVELARTPTVDERDVDEVLQDFIDTARARRYVTRGGAAYAREVLERAVGTSRAAEILDRLAQASERQPFEALRGAPPDQIYALVQRESPQMIALVVASLPTRELRGRGAAAVPGRAAGRSVAANRAARADLAGRARGDRVARARSARFSRPLRDGGVQRHRAPRRHPQRRRPGDRAQRPRAARCGRRGASSRRSRRCSSCSRTSSG